MNRITWTNEINHFLNLFAMEVESLNRSNLYDINIHAENAVIPLLNEVYGFDLVNANIIEKNFPAVDLVDYANRVAIQVTATADSDKITHTVNKFVEKKLYESFDTLYIYILSEKLDYRKDFNPLTQGQFVFNVEEHIFDNQDLFQIISRIPNGAILKRIKEHLEVEFSREKLDERKKTLTQEVQILPSEPYILNFVEIGIPDRIYMAPVNLHQDRQSLTEDIQTFRKTQKSFQRRRAKISERDLMRRAISKMDQGFHHDWILFGGNLITFRNLHDPAEPLLRFVDRGAIESSNACEFWQKDDDYLRAFKNLLGMSFRQRFIKIGLEWEHEKKLYRFKASESLAPIKVTWKKDKRSATREVFSEVWNKDKSHVVCFKHL